MALVSRFRQWAFRLPLSWICPIMMWATRFVASSRVTLQFCPRVGLSRPQYLKPGWTLSWIGYVSRL